MDEFEPDLTLPDRVNQHLQGLYQSEQAALYAALLRPQARGGRFSDDTLLELQEELTTRKALVRSYINLFYPDQLIDSDEIRAAMRCIGICGLVAESQDVFTANTDYR